MPHSPTSSSSMTLSSFSTRTTPRCQIGSKSFWKKTIFSCYHFLSRPLQWPPGLFQDQNNSMNFHWSIQNIGDVLLIHVEYFYFHCASYREKNLDADPCKEDPDYSFQARHSCHPNHETKYIKISSEMLVSLSTALYSAYTLFTLPILFTLFTL